MPHIIFKYDFNPLSLVIIHVKYVVGVEGGDVGGLGVAGVGEEVEVKEVRDGGVDYCWVEGFY